MARQRTTAKPQQNRIGNTCVRTEPPRAGKKPQGNRTGTVKNRNETAVEVVVGCRGEWCA